jgi:broad specificity phosphatase PhoE
MNHPIYLIRHATPDWSRKDIPYNLPPGPPLIEKGKAEARLLGHFLKQSGLRRIYYSPFERTRSTAEIVAATSRIPIEERQALSEWREDEPEASMSARLLPFWEWCLQNNAAIGPVGLVMHAGPVGFLLQRMGIDPEILEKHRHLYDYTNPMPPAGVWRLQKAPSNGAYQFDLIFKPEVK